MQGGTPAIGNSSIVHGCVKHQSVCGHSKIQSVLLSCAICIPKSHYCITVQWKNHKAYEKKAGGGLGAKRSKMA